MRLVIQRVSAASVSVKGEVVGEIGSGFFILLGVSKKDSKKDVQALIEKLVKLRIMADRDGKMNLSIMDTASEVLVVSQFTLYADTTKGNRPSFIKAAEPITAERLYSHFLEKLKEKKIKVKTGSFGDYMQIDAKLDGPVTIILDS